MCRPGLSILSVIDKLFDSSGLYTFVASAVLEAVLALP
jgi:hypothetical protein